MSNEERKLISRREAARRIGISHVTLMNWEQKEIAPKHFQMVEGGTVYYDEEDVEQFVRDQEDANPAS